MNRLPKILSSKDAERECYLNNITLLTPWKGPTTFTGKPISYRVQCRTCKKIFYTTFTGHSHICPRCRSAEYRSQRERQLVQYILSLGHPVLISDRTVLAGQEIDIYVPTLEVGFEVNGHAFHFASTSFPTKTPPKDRNYHYLKSFLALQRGVALYHLWDYESNEFVFNVVKEVLSGNRRLSTIDVDKNPYLLEDPSKIKLVPWYYMETGENQGILLPEKPLKYDSSVRVYELYNAGYRIDKK